MAVSELPVEVELKHPTSAVGAGTQTTNPQTPPEVSSQQESANSVAAAVTAATAPAPAPNESTGKPAEIKLEQIAPNPHQPRRQMNQALLAELAASIKSSGIIQPLVVRKVDSGYQLIAGERRFRAAKLAGLQTIPAIIRDVDSSTQAQMALVENIQREDLNPIDRASAYRALMTHLGLTQSELASRIGEDRSIIAHYLRLLDLTEVVRDLVRDAQISFGHAKLLAGVSDILEQQRLAELCITQDLSVRNLERLLSTAPQAVAPRAAGKGSAHLLDLEKTISRELGMRVQVHSARNGKGRVVLHYASLDQFDELMKRMGVKVE